MVATSRLGDRKIAHIPAHPDIILHNASIFTVDPSLPWATAVAIRGSQITAVGQDVEVLSLIGERTEVVDVKGRLVLPGLCDAHIHLYDWSLSLGQVALAGCKHKDELMDRVKEGAFDDNKSPWIIGRGWNETNWQQQEPPTCKDLDEVTGKSRPAIFWRSDMHCAVVNSAALRTAGIGPTTADPEGGRIGRDEDGSANGLLWELAINLVSDLVPTPSAQELENRIEEGLVRLNSLGITAVHDQRMKDQKEGPAALAAYQRLWQKGRLTGRINCNVAAHDLPHLGSLGIGSGFGNEYLRIGHLKMFADGSLGSKTAWMLSPLSSHELRHGDEYGLNLTAPEKMAEDIRRASQLNIPTSVHAIGDRANRVVIDIFEELSQSGPRVSIPHRIEHVQIIDPEDLPRLAALGITASVQPIHAIDDMEIADRLLGRRASRAYRFRSLANSGAALALGSDAPVADPNPFLGMHAAVCRQRPDQMERGPWFGSEQLTLEQTVHGYTMGPAAAAGWQEVIGSITPGKKADLIVLDRNLFALEEEGIMSSELAETVVDLTIFDGQFIKK